MGSYEQDNVAGRGLCGVAYRLPPRLAHDATRVLRHSAYDRRRIAGLTVRVVSRIRKPTDSLQAIDDVVFVVWGFLFWTVWDEWGNVYITHALAERLGVNGTSDQQLTDIVLAPGPSPLLKQRALSQIWLYWTIKMGILQERPRSVTEKHLA